MSAPYEMCQEKTQHSFHCLYTYHYYIEFKINYKSIHINLLFFFKKANQHIWYTSSLLVTEAWAQKQKPRANICWDFTVLRHLAPGWLIWNQRFLQKYALLLKWADHTQHKGSVMI